MTTTDGHGVQRLDPRVGARGVVGGPPAKVGCSLCPRGTFSLAAVQTGFHVLFEAILWRGDGAGVGPVLTGIWL